MFSRVLKNSPGYRACIFPRVPHHRAKASARRLGLALMVAGSIWLAPAAGAQMGRPSLPTPSEHYARFNLRSAALALVPRIAP